MCGIVAWLAADGTTVDRDVLGQMRDRLAHRGPDGAGLWLDDPLRVGLGFRRLAIIDLADTASQPMPNEDHSVHVVFNGEIYNHRALRQELEAAGHVFRTDHSDTETIVHGYEQWGDDVVKHLTGMFAFAIWDATRQRLLLARDRIGIKPLYFTWAAGSLLIASEIKALLAHPAVSPAINPHGLYHYLSFLTTPAPLTMFRGIYKMPAGYRAVVEGDRFRAERYWDALPVNIEYGDQQAIVNRTRELLDQAVEKRLMSDVPFGVFLSGGVDSSAIVAMMSRHLSTPVRTFTVGFSDHERLNELDHARAVARHFRTDHREVLVDERAMREYLPQLVYSQDEPIADWVCIPLYFVSKLVRDSGTVVVHVGEGSDEQFCGYDSYMGYLRLYRRYWQPFQRLPGPLQRLIAGSARLLSRSLGRGGFYADIIERAAQGREHFWGGAMSYWEPAKRRLLNGYRPDPDASDIPPGLETALPGRFLTPDTFEVVSHYLEHFDRLQPGADVLARMAYLEFKLRLPELLLMRVDKITMSTSIEARVPFLDHALVEYTAGLPLALKTQGGQPKFVLKKALEPVLPHEIIYRKKMGFGAPMREWLRGEFGREAEATITGSRLRREGIFDYTHIGDMFRRHRSGEDLSLPLWTLYNLTAWYDHWIGGSAAR
jgi:asparagine synthase (glutamine-hydrolysing)